MGKQLSVLMFFIFTLTTLRAQDNAEQQKVNQAVTKLFDGIAGLNMDMIRNAATGDFLLLEDGEIWNTDTLINTLSTLKGVSFTRTNHLDFIRTQIDGNTAWVAYNNTADMTINGQKRYVRWLESAVLVKTGKEWKIKLLHSTVVTRQNPG